MLAAEGAPHQLLDELSRHAAGNPFFVGEYLRAAVEDGLLVREHRSRWRVTGALRRERVGTGTEELVLPPTILALVQRRLAALGDRATETVHTAAVLGRQCQAGLLRQLVGIEPGDWPALVEELSNRDVMRAAGDQLVFAHDKVREAAYRALAVEARAQLHLRAADALEGGRAPGEQAAEQRPTLAHHLEMAGQHDRAARYLELAAQDAFDAGAFADAAGRARRLLQWREEGVIAAAQARVVGLWRLLAGAQLALGRVDEVKAAAGRALDAAGRPLPGTPRQWQTLTLKHMGALLLQWLTGERLRFGSSATPDAERDVALALGYLSEHYYADNDAISMAGTLVTPIHVLMSTGQADALAIPWSRFGYLLGQLKLRGPAQRCFSRAQRIASSQGRSADLAFVHAVEGNWHFAQGRWQEAEAALQQTLTLCEQSPDPYAEGIALTILGMCRHLTGRSAEALPLFERVFASADDRGALQHRGFGLLGRASALAGLQRHDEALALLDAEEAFFAERMDRGSRVVFHGHRAWSALASEDLARGRKEAEAILALTDRELLAQPSLLYGLAPLAAVGAVLSGTPDGGPAGRSLLEAAERQLKTYNQQFPLGKPVALWTKAALLRANDQREKAENCAKKAIEAARALDLRYAAEPPRPSLPPR